MKHLVRHYTKDRSGFACIYLPPWLHSSICIYTRTQIWTPWCSSLSTLSITSLHFKCMCSQLYHLFVYFRTISDITSVLFVEVGLFIKKYRTCKILVTWIIILWLPDTLSYSSGEWWWCYLSYCEKVTRERDKNDSKDFDIPVEWTFHPTVLMIEIFDSTVLSVGAIL